jgi:ABC-2 type transport system ATP-binding protein
VIELKNLTKQFKNIIAVDNVSLEIDEGEIFGFLGPNGAGKTTTIRMLGCVVKPTSGTAILDGYDILKDSMKIRERIGVLTENPCIYERLSGIYNLKFFGKLYGVPDDVLDDRVEYLLNLFDLKDRANDKSGTYSKGMKQKLAIARTLLHEPQIIFFDEPTSGLDPKMSKNLRDYIKKLSQDRKITIFLSTHNLSEAEYLCDKIAVINEGKIIDVGKPKELSRRLWGGEKIQIRIRDNLKEKNITNSMITSSLSDIPGVNEVSLEDNIIYVSSKSAEDANPQIIKDLVSLDLDIIEVKLLEHSIEDIYLQLIKE